MAGGLREATTWRDAKGNTVRVSYFVASTGTAITQATAAQNVINTIVPLTNATGAGAIGPLTVPRTEVVYGTNSPYPNVEDKANFTFQDANGSIHRFQVPAPKDTIFLADGETVDPANTDVVAFVAAVIANCVTAEGNAIAFGANGTRIRRKMHRKFNIFTKDPALTGPGE